ncbi:MAG: ankyrin repeat domain-containing protein [Gemmatimonadetes bacterium]|nr:ankyrin repeat domain-containing protein [Gemmatimonadota bacterium]MYG86122.1 ankyrin repeat domain-containing protein [Gemmatimonadota bacterium]MYJ90378.1 ankyrin repeat domain-containing protein [Gemmatimonadota bacterium]
MADTAIVQLPDQPDLVRLEAEAEGLLEEGSCPSLPDARQRIADRYGFPSWSKLASYVGSIGTMGTLERAIQADDTDRVRLLLRDDPGLIHREGHWVKRRRHNGYRPLAYAAFFGRTGVMKTLIDAGADVHEGEEKALRAAACFDRNLPAVDLLLGRGADPDASTTSPSGVPYRVIDYPCMTLAPAMLDRLASAGGTLLSDNAGMILATNERRPVDKAACLRVLKQAGISLPDTPPMALHLRDRDRLEWHLDGDPHMLERLFSVEEIFPSDFGIRHPAPYACATPLAGGVTLLHMAVEFCDVEMARWLLEQGADVNAPAGTDDEGYGGWTPLFHTMASLHVPRNFTDMADLLLEHGADPAVRASLRKPTPEGGEYTWRDVTAAEYARRFVYPDLVNQDALRHVTEAGG